MEKKKRDLIEISEDETVVYYNTLGNSVSLSAQQIKFVRNSFKTLGIELPGKCEYREPIIGEHILDFGDYSIVCAEEEHTNRHHFVVSSAVITIG